MKCKNQKNNIELSLCPKCASVYYNDKNYYIERADPMQTVYEECAICKNLYGHDFNIWVKSNMQTENSNNCGGDRK